MEELDSAIKFGESETLREILRNNPDLIDQKYDTLEMTVLHKSIETMDINIFLILVKDFNANVNIKNKFGKSPLDVAKQLSTETRDSQLDILNQMIDLLSSVEKLETAINSGDSKDMCDIFRIHPDLVDYKYGYQKRSALHLACKNFQVDILRILITELYANVSIQDKFGITPLNFARQKLAKFAKSDTQNDDESFYKIKEIIELLKNSLMDKIDCAINIGDSQMMCEILRNNSVLTLVDEHYGRLEMTPLHKAIEVMRVDIFRILIKEFNADVNIKDKLGRTPLEFAKQLSTTANHKQLELLKQIIESLEIQKIIESAINESNLKDLRDILSIHPELVNKKYGSNKMSGLHITCEKLEIEMFEILVKEFHADIDIKDKFGRTPLEFAKQLLKTSRDRQLELINQMIELLESLKMIESAITENRLTKLREILGIHPDLVDVQYGEQKMTALHLACNNFQVDIIRTLIAEFNANENIQNKYGITPLTLAIQLSKSAHSELLEEINKIIDILTNSLTNKIDGAIKSGDSQTLFAILRNNSVSTLVDRQYGNLEMTALHRSIESSQMDISRILVIKFNADIKIKDKLGRTPLEFAKQLSKTAHQKEIESFNQIIELIESVKTIESSIYKNNSKNLREILLIHPDLVDYKYGTQKRSALHLACKIFELEQFRILVNEFNANVNIQDKSGKTPLILAKQISTGIYHQPIRKSIIDEIIKILTEDPHIKLNIQDNSNLGASSYGDVPVSI